LRGQMAKAAKSPRRAVAGEGADAAPLADAALIAGTGPDARLPAARRRRVATPEGRRAEILAAALEEFTARGFAAARLDDVARRAGVAKGTIYLYFADKEALFQELVRSMVNPILGTLEHMRELDMPARVLVEGMLGTFVREIFGTRRKDLIRLIFAEGPRFPAIAEFYYREVVSRVLAIVRPLLARAHARGELPNDALVRFPQLIIAPGLVAIMWSALFEKYEPLDVPAMIRAHIDILFGGRGP
jgi:AcrR family transcriptional regulator